MNVLLGIGNPRHGDDALGPVFARAFRHPNWRTIRADTAPENYTGFIRRLHPEWLVLLDAAELGLPPGTLKIIAPSEISATQFGTHAGSIGHLANYLSDCAEHILIVGIQPADIRPGARLSPPIRATLRKLAAQLTGKQPLATDFTDCTDKGQQPQKPQMNTNERKCSAKND